MRPSRVALCAALLAMLAAPAFAAARLTYSMGGAATPVIWPRSSFPIPYKVDARVVSTLGEGAVARAFSAWTSVPDSDVSFRSLGTSEGVKAGYDNQNTISMLDGLYKDQGFIAVTTNWYDSRGNMTEADIQFDGSLTTSGYNVSQTVEHEVGHLLGLDHSAVLTSVMYPYISRAPGQPSLDSDDKIAISTLYPRSDPALAGGTLTGRVVGNDGAIFAAQVVAVNDHGEPVATSLTNEAGEFVLQSLPTGTYRVYAEPLDGPVDPRNLDGVWRGAKDTSFPTQFVAGAPLRVDNGTVQGNLMISSSGAPVTLNPKWIGINSKDTGDFQLTSTPVAAQAGQTVAIAVGGDGFTSGMTTFEVMNPRVKRVSDFRYAGNFTWARFAISADAAAGSAVILVTSGNESATLTGALRIGESAAPQRVRIVRR